MAIGAYFLFMFSILKGLL